MEGKYIVIVDDSPDLQQVLGKYLRKEGFAVEGIPSGEDLFEFLKKEKPDLIILDRILPGMNGFEICKRIRDDERLALIPIVMLSGKGETVDRISGLNIGADDYITKPFDLNEMRARIEAILRRRGSEGKDRIMSIGDEISIDLQKCQVMVSDKRIDLTFAEFKILELLALRKGQVFSRKRILEYLWGDEKIVVERTVDFHIKNLREKLGEAGRHIKNVRGFGYQIEE